jgi:hypothetical protein
MAKALTHSELAARLVVEGSLDKIAGKATEKFPVEGGSLTQEQRASMNLKPGGRTIVYEVPPNGVFIDFNGGATTVWFNNADSSDALKLLEKALKKAYPKAVQREDKIDPTNKSRRLRSYDVPLSKDRAATVDIAYFAPGAEARGFLVRILAFGKVDKKTDKKKH